MDDSVIFFVGLGVFLVVVTAIILTMAVTYKIADNESERNRVAEQNKK